MYCGSCGNPIRENAHFCGKCGKPKRNNRPVKFETATAPGQFGSQYSRHRKGKSRKALLIASVSLLGCLCLSGCLMAINIFYQAIPEEPDNQTILNEVLEEPDNQTISDEIYEEVSLSQAILDDIYGKTHIDQTLLDDAYGDGIQRKAKEVLSQSKEYGWKPSTLRLPGNKEKKMLLVTLQSVYDAYDVDYDTLKSYPVYFAEGNIEKQVGMCFHEPDFIVIEEKNWEYDCLLNTAIHEYVHALRFTKGINKNEKAKEEGETVLITAFIMRDIFSGLSENVTDRYGLSMNNSVMDFVEFENDDEYIKYAREQLSRIGGEENIYQLMELPESNDLALLPLLPVAS